MTHATNRAFDILIDDVAREVTSGRPTGTWVPSVLARLSAEPQAVTPRVAWPWIGAGAAAAVVLVASLVLPRALVRFTRVSVPAISVPAAVTPADGPVVTRTAGAVAHMTRASRARHAVPAPALLAWRARTIPELAMAEPLALSEIQPAGLSITQLDVVPLGIAPLTLLPIGGEGGRR